MFKQLFARFDDHVNVAIGLLTNALNDKDENLGKMVSNIWNPRPGVYRFVGSDLDTMEDEWQLFDPSAHKGVAGAAFPWIKRYDSTERVPVSSIDGLKLFSEFLDDFRYGMVPVSQVIINDNILRLELNVFECDKCCVGRLEFRQGVDSGSALIPFKTDKGLIRAISKSLVKQLVS